jgi:hypothetical protein
VGVLASGSNNETALSQDNALAPGSSSSEAIDNEAILPRGNTLLGAFEQHTRYLQGWAAVMAPTINDAMTSTPLINQN